jgi:2,3-bisphosphoglycerate-dependent phosphoglycerate mutase
MRIYILRHEDRTMDATFFSPLTELGIENSIKLIKLLDKYNINCIFSSPFLRTLQTIHPYAKSKNYKINIDHCLSEIQHPHLIPVKSYTINLPIYLAEKFNYNPDYVSMMDPNNHNYPETNESVYSRTKKFLSKIIDEMTDSDLNIVIVTHQIICNNIIKITSRKSELNYDISSNYPRGGLTLVFDKDKFVFEPINWKYTGDKI